MNLPSLSSVIGVVPCPSCLSNSTTFRTLSCWTGSLRDRRLFELVTKPKRSFSKTGSTVIVMRDRSKNRKPLQRGRVSTEAIQTVQALKRAKKDSNLLERVFESKFRRLLKSDMIAVLRELQRQNDPLLALQVFEDIRKEYWYKPRVMIHADMIALLANNGMVEKAETLFLNLKMEERLIEASDIEGFNALLRILMEAVNCKVSLDCYHLMKAVGCEPDRSTFWILINGLETRGETGLSAILREEAEGYFGDLEFLEEVEDTNNMRQLSSSLMLK